MAAKFSDILAALPRYKEAADAVREVLLANLVLASEIPAPTFGEEKRIAFLKNRFSECGLINTCTDEVGNGLGVLAGESGEQGILVVAHADTVFDERQDHTIAVQPDRIVGPGVADNGLGLAVLATLPTLLEELGLRLQSDVILMASARSLGRGDLEGLRFFLDNNTMPIRAGVCVEGVELGRLSIGSIGMLRGEISCTVPAEYDWTRFGASGAIATMNEVISKMSAIALPRKPRTSIVLGQFEGGVSFNTVARNAVLGFEIRSDCADTVTRIRKEIEDIVAEVASNTGAHVAFDVLARRKPGGIPFAHPLAARSRRIMKALDIQYRMAPSTSELSAFIGRDVPAVTIGITSGENLNEPMETVMIDSVSTGLAQLVGILHAIDGGFCNERK